MMPSPPIDDRIDTRPSGRLPAGSAQACASTPDWSAVASPISSHTMRVHSFAPTRLTLTRQKADRHKRSAPTSSSHTPWPNPHSACGTAAAPLPAISCLGAFRPPAARARGEVRHCRQPKTCTGADLAAHSRADLIPITAVCTSSRGCVRMSRKPTWRIHSRHCAAVYSKPPAVSISMLRLDSSA